MGRGAAQRYGDHLSEDEHGSTEWDGGTLLGDVTPESIRWLWDGYIPLGKLTMGDGDPGLGKTMLYAADIATRVTTGREMPDGSPGIDGGAGVVIFTAEDDPADTIQPRFVAARGDVAKVLVVTTMQRRDPDTGKLLERLPSFSDTAFIERKIKQMDAKLVIFDPFMAYLPREVNSFRDQDVRSALTPLGRLAQKTGAAFVLIRHLNKGSGGNANALYRGGGSIGIIGAARAGLLIVKDPDDEHLRIVGQTKSNLGRPKPSWTYRIVEDDCGLPRIHWEGQSERDAKEVLNISGDKDRPSKLKAACDLLRDALKDGEQTEEYLTGEAKSQGIGIPTLRRAKKDLRVQSLKRGVGRASYWVWSLLDKGDHDTAKDDHIAADDHLSRDRGYKGGQEADLPKGDQGDRYDHVSECVEHLTELQSEDEEEGSAEWIR